jgi:adenine/guanine phosphoribosyltransferase-like PRPP-binding protein
MSYYFHGGYLKGEGIAETVKSCKALLKKKKLDFDTIGVRGHSGMLIGAPLAMQLKKDLLIVRKKGEKSHSSNSVTGWGRDQKILLVDDFICTGATLKAMHKEIKANCDSPTILGILLYASGRRETEWLLTNVAVPMFHVEVTSRD